MCIRDSFVNAPRPSKLLEEVLNELDLDNPATDETFWGVHFRFRYTLADTKGWSSELEELDDQVKDRLKAGQDRGLISLSVRSELTGWEDLLQEVKSVPSHLTVVFDPFEVRTTLVARAGLHDMSPWMPSCEYRYNKLKKQIVIVPIAEAVSYTHLDVYKRQRKRFGRGRPTSRNARPARWRSSRPTRRRARTRWTS